jgi:hypothetical protein
MTKIFVNDPNKCHHSQPLPGNNIYIYIYTPWWEQVVVPLLYWIRHWRCQPLPAMTSSCHVSPVFYGWWMSGPISSNTIIWYIYIHILSPLLLCTIINIIIYYYYHYCCYNIYVLGIVISILKASKWNDRGFKTLLKCGFKPSPLM